MLDKELVDKTRIGRKQHLPGQGPDKAGQHKRNQEHALHKSLVGQVRPGNQPGKESTYDSTADGSTGSDDERVLQSLKGIRLGQNFHHVLYIEMTFYPESVKQDKQHRESHHDNQDGYGQEQDELAYTDGAFCFNRGSAHSLTTSFKSSARNQSRFRKLTTQGSPALNIRSWVRARWVSMLVRRCSPSISMRYSIMAPRKLA